MQVLILDAHPIYRRGIASSLLAIPDLFTVTEAGSVAEAWALPDLQRADVVLVDHDIAGGLDFIRDVREHTRASVVVCSATGREEEVLAAIQAGATGYLCKATLTPEALLNGMQASAAGAGVVAPELLRPLLDAIGRLSREVLEPRGLSVARLTDREQQVLRLIAEGHATREVAHRLAYSERTVKNVLHDATMKLNARSRSQAVAHAVREGLI